MEFDKVAFNLSLRPIDTFETSQEKKMFLMKYLELANQKQANLTDKEVCVSKSDKQRRDDFTKAALTGLLGNSVTLDRTIDALRKCDFYKNLDTNKIISMASVEIAKATIAELDK
jgi:hypothetical protein